MPSLYLTTKISTEELIQKLKIVFPNYKIHREFASRVFIDTAGKGYFYAQIIGNRVYINVHIHPIKELFFGLTIIPGILYEIGNHNNPIARDILHKLTNEIKIDKTTLQVIEMIPDSCPHCKNPNTKKIRLCEWCGNRIV